MPSKCANCSKCEGLNNTEFKHCEHCRVARRKWNAKYDLTPKSKALNKRWNDKANPVNGYKRIVTRRTRFLNDGLRGFDLFNRSIGVNLVSRTGHLTLGD